MNRESVSRLNYANPPVNHSPGPKAPAPLPVFDRKSLSPGNSPTGETKKKITAFPLVPASDSGQIVSCPPIAPPMPSLASIPVCLAMLFALGTALEADWDERQIGKRSYVSANSLKEFYKFQTLTRSGKSITLERSDVRIRLRQGSQECLMNGMKFIFSHPVAVSGGKAWISKIDLTKLVDPVLRPKFIGSAGNFRTVVIDPGHGGKDAGATNAYGTEADYNLTVSRYLKRLLEKQGFRVVMTREDDRYLSLQQRVNLANEIEENAIFISVHHNSARRSSARGIETFTLSPVGVAHYGRGLKASDFQKRAGNTHDSANVALASAVHSRLLVGLKDKKSGRSYTLDRGIKRARFSVLSGVRHPSILIECGFMSNGYEAKLIHDTGYQRRVAAAIAEAVVRYRIIVGGTRP